MFDVWAINARMKLRIRFWRKHKELTLDQLAERSGFAVSQLSRWEKWDGGKDRAPTADQISKIADALGITMRDLMPDGGPIPVVGYVGAGQQVYGIDDFAVGQGMYHVQCPSGLDPKTTVALEVRGGSMPPAADGWVVFYSRHTESDAVSLINRICIVKTSAGAYFMKKLRPARESHKFNLISGIGDPIEDIDLEWASPVLASLPPEQISRADGADEV